ncbi:hypothetical protein D3C73_1264010 [compost metagenome]
MMGAVTQVDAQLEVECTSRAEENSRSGRAQARAVRGDEDVGRQLVAMLHAELTQPRRTRLFAHFQQQLDVKPQATAPGLDDLL